MSPETFADASLAVAGTAIVAYLAVCLGVACSRVTTALVFFVLSLGICGVAQAQESLPSGVYDYARSTLDRKVIVEPGGRIRSEPVPPRTGRSVEYVRPVAPPQPASPLGKNRPLTDQELVEIFSRPSTYRTR